MDKQSSSGLSNVIPFPSSRHETPTTFQIMVTPSTLEGRELLLNAAQTSPCNCQIGTSPLGLVLVLLKPDTGLKITLATPESSKSISTRRSWIKALLETLSRFGRTQKNSSPNS